MNTENTMRENRSGTSPLRIAAWSLIPLILFVPLVAMQFTDEVDWTLFDFIFAAALLSGVGLALEFALRRSGSYSYRIAFGLAILGAFLLVWINGAVGIIGSEENDANLMYFGVLAVIFAGAIIARFKPAGMAYAMFAAAGAQAFIAAIAVIGGLGLPESGPLEILGVNGMFVAIFVGSALLFRWADSQKELSKT